MISKSKITILIGSVAGLFILCSCTVFTNREAYSQNEVETFIFNNCDESFRINSVVVVREKQRKTMYYCSTDNGRIKFQGISEWRKLTYLGI